MTRANAERAAERERDTIDTQRRAERFAALGRPRPVAIVAAGPRPDWVAPTIPPPPPPRPRRARSSGPRNSSHRPAAAPGKCSICRIRDVKPPRVMTGRTTAGQVKTHKVCQHCIDERTAYKNRKRAAAAG